MQTNFLQDADAIRKLKTLSLSDLNQVSENIRKKILEVVSKNGGHLASNFGSVELTLALYRSFVFPEEDTLVWDTGHQAYTHKMLTGRYSRFDTLRLLGGISGFTSRSESAYDSFGAGHVGTGVGAGLGFEQVMRQENRQGNVVVVVGDGALTNGNTLEALNQVSNLNSTIRIIINDNGMSIGENVGSFARSFSLLRTNPSYATIKQGVKSFLVNSNLEPFETVLEKIRDSLKSYLLPQNIFENMGFKYIGPIDGHDIELMTRIFDNLKADFRKATVVHVVTQKGKGFQWSELQPRKFHGIGPFQVEDGKIVSQDTSGEISFSQACGITLTELAKRDPKLVAITAAMEDGTGFSSFKAEHATRFYDLGITESFCTLFAGAFASKGWHPVFGVYSTFLQRAYDNIIHDIALQRLPAIFCVDRAGLVPDDGPTHHGVFDMSFLQTIPGVRIYNPRNLFELIGILKQFIVKEWPKQDAVFVRYPKLSNTVSRETLMEWINAQNCFENGDWQILKQEEESEFRSGSVETLVFSTGVITASALELVSVLHPPYKIIHACRIKPFDWKCIQTCFEDSVPKRIVTIEEGMKIGGFGQNLTLELLKNYGSKIVSFENFALPDTFIEVGSREQLLTRYQLDSYSIRNTLKATENDFSDLESLQRTKE